jgi:RNA polymerase sigma-70 factor (ECF subfamily)
MDEKAEPLPPLKNQADLIESLMAEHEASLLRYAMRLVNSSHAAQDVVQNVFIKLFKEFSPGSKPGAQIRAWLFRVTHNEAVDYIRRESRFRNMQDRFKEEEAAREPEDPVPARDKNEQLKMVLSCLDVLTEREKQIVLLRLDEGLSYKEIATITDRTVGNVGNILHHSIKKLSNKMKQRGVY